MDRRCHACDLEGWRGIRPYPRLSRAEDQDDVFPYQSQSCLTSTQQADILVGLIEHVITVGKTSCDNVEAAELERVEVDVQPSNMAYAFFISGGTGTPKVSRRRIEKMTMCDQGPD